MIRRSLAFKEVKTSSNKEVVYPSESKPMEIGAANSAACYFDVDIGFISRLRIISLPDYIALGSTLIVRNPNFKPGIVMHYGNSLVQNDRWGISANVKRRNKRVMAAEYCQIKIKTL